MAINLNTGSSSSQPFLPIFSGEKYEFWNIKMKTLFMSQDLWDLVSDGFVDLIDPTEDQIDDVWFVDRQEQNPVC